MIEKIDMYQVRCDKADHEHSDLTDDGLLIDFDVDAVAVWSSPESARREARECGWQVTVAGVFCPEHVVDARPLEQPGPTLLDALAPVAIDPIDPDLRRLP